MYHCICINCYYIQCVFQEYKYYVYLLRLLIDRYYQFSESSLISYRYLSFRKVYRSFTHSFQSNEPWNSSAISAMNKLLHFCLCPLTLNFIDADIASIATGYYQRTKRWKSISKVLIESIQVWTHVHWIFLYE